MRNLYGFDSSRLCDTLRCVRNEAYRTQRLSAAKRRVADKGASKLITGPVPMSAFGGITLTCPDVCF
jgi:hypothetical protein